MVRTMPVTEVKAKLLALLDEVERGEEIEITRHGRTIARITPAREPHALKGMFQGLVWTTDPDDDLSTTGVTWTMDAENLVDDDPS
jgi:prevent-host-death family protein